MRSAPQSAAALSGMSKRYANELLKVAAEEPAPRAQVCSTRSCAAPLTTAYCRRAGFCNACMKAPSLPATDGETEAVRFCQQVRLLPPSGRAAPLAAENAPRRLLVAAGEPCRPPPAEKMLCRLELRFRGVPCALALPPETYTRHSTGGCAAVRAGCVWLSTPRTLCCASLAPILCFSLSLLTLLSRSATSASHAPPSRAAASPARSR